uniref:Uncharacterized protein n=1 Tax=Labrus bergylta TaxID=56723 RepID=A0A3Q3M8L6_9LABR
MVYHLPGMQTEAHSVRPGQLLDMFDSSWKVRSIWDGVRLELEQDRSPVVLHSFTHLDPDLPLLEVRGGGGTGRRGREEGDGEAAEDRYMMRFVVLCSRGIFLGGVRE